MNNESAKRLAALIQCFFPVLKLILSRLRESYSFELNEKSFMNEKQFLASSFLNSEARRFAISSNFRSVEHEKCSSRGLAEHASRAELAFESSQWISCAKLDAVLTPIRQNVNAARKTRTETDEQSTNK